MKKKIFSIFLVMVLCIGMTAGCKKNVGTSQDNAIAEEDDDSKEEAKSYRFGFSCITMENPYYITLEQALREAVEAQGSTLVTRYRYSFLPREKPQNVHLRFPAR